MPDEQKGDASLMPERDRFDKLTVRPLKVYALDPTAGRNLNNYMTIQVPHEPLVPGPVGKYLAVIDYDGSNNCYYRAVNLDHPSVLMQGGLEPSESNPFFHQQMVYAVATETIRRFEFALGRRIKWRRDLGSKEKRYHGKLRIFPHAFQQANAFYDPELRALVFGYFPASATDVGANLPDQTVFTCLSHDILVHETTHAIVDGLREYFTEPTSADTPAFHEAFADIMALFQHFSLREALLDTINRTGGLIHRIQIDPEIAPAGKQATIVPELSTSNPLVGLAQQFGEAMGMRAALRSALGTVPNSRDLDRFFEPHQRGSILVAAVFDAFFTIYIKRTRDLMRIARAGGTLGPGDLHPDLANRLATEASKTAAHFMNICVRSIDYCPPVDIQFGEFLRAMITADSDLIPDDKWGYRSELIKAFRLRGIIPEEVSSYSEEALRWCCPDVTGKPVPPCKGLEFEVVEDTGEEDCRKRNEDRQKHNAIVLTQFAKQNAAALGLNPDLTINAHSFYPIHRVGPDGQLVIEFVVEFLQKRPEVLDPQDPASPQFTFRGGSTVIIDHQGDVRYVIAKSIDKKKRLDRQREFHLRLGANSAMAAYVTKPEVERLNFEAIHRGF